MWAGAAVHEVAQVIAAAFGDGNDNGEWGTIVKLTRVAALVPFATILSYFAQQGIVKNEERNRKVLLKIFSLQSK